MPVETNPFLPRLTPADNRENHRTHIRPASLASQTVTSNPLNHIRNAVVALDLQRGKHLLRGGQNGPTANLLTLNHPISSVWNKLREGFALRAWGTSSQIINRILNAFGRERTTNKIVNGFSDQNTLNSLQRALGEPVSEVQPQIEGYGKRLMNSLIDKYGLEKVMSELLEIKGTREFITLFKKAPDFPTPLSVPTEQLV